MRDISFTHVPISISIHSPEQHSLPSSIGAGASTLLRMVRSRGIVQDPPIATQQRSSLAPLVPQTFEQQLSSVPVIKSGPEESVGHILGTASPEAKHGVTDGVLVVGRVVGVLVIGLLVGAFEGLLVGGLGSPWTHPSVDWPP